MGNKEMTPDTEIQHHPKVIITMNSTYLFQHYGPLPYDKVAFEMFTWFDIISPLENKYESYIALHNACKLWTVKKHSAN